MPHPHTNPPGGGDFYPDTGGQPVSGCRHPYKYRLALVVDGECVLRYDNEAGKGDHRHGDGQESPYPFTEIEQLVADFLTDVTRWQHDHDNL